MEIEKEAKRVEIANLDDEDRDYMKWFRWWKIGIIGNSNSASSHHVAGNKSFQHCVRTHCAAENEVNYLD